MTFAQLLAKVFLGFPQLTLWLFWLMALGVSTAGEYLDVDNRLLTLSTSYVLPMTSVFLIGFLIGVVQWWIQEWRNIKRKW